ncbi:hypothetical protein HK104_009574 [Borealophlyctis nickersoniae]|nr:hypothetical protein HK104_009574 [Borealophlyctis nickersoniae]
MSGEGTRATAKVGYSESKGKSCLSSAAYLSQEILLHILRLVPRQRRPTILACCLVNKTWHKAAMYLLWEVVDTDVDSLAFLLSPGIAAKASNTRSLHLCSIANYYIYDDYSFEPIIGDESFPFSNLRALAIERVRFNVFDLAQIFDACPNIVVLAIDLWVDLITDETEDGDAVCASLRAGFGRLQSFTICERDDPFHDNPIKDAEIPLISLAVSSFGSSLQALVCGRWGGNDHPDLFSPLASQCQNLVHLSLLSCYNALPLISCSPKLVQLKCRFTSEVPDAVVKNCPHLRRVVVSTLRSSLVNYFIEAGPPRTMEALGIEDVIDGHPVNWAGLLAYFGSNSNCLILTVHLTVLKRR